MRTRKKKHLTERVIAARDVLIVADDDVLDSRKANLDKKYFNFNETFFNGNPVELEIGCGKGAFIIEKAKRNPNTNYLAVELLQNVIISAAESAIKQNVPNVKFFNCGADYLARYVALKSVNAIYLNFSPPFSGKRYENRRLTKSALIKDYATFLTDGGAVYQKTDDKAFFEYSFNSFTENGFSVEIVDADATDNVLTEYEKKFRALGMPVYALKAMKKPVY